MLGRIVKWLNRRRLDAQAIDAAVRTFEQVSGQRAHPVATAVIHRDPGRLVVCVCYGQTRPPDRAWFAVADGTGEVQELSWAEAQQLGARPWR